MLSTFSRNDWRNLLVVASIYVAATALYALLGVRFVGIGMKLGENYRYWFLVEPRFMTLPVTAVGD